MCTLCSIDHYQPWAPGVPQDFDDIPSPAPLKEHQAVLSVLFALQGSAPEPQPTLTALPALGSSTLAAVQQRAAAAVAAAAAGPQSWGASAAWQLSWLEQADATKNVQQQKRTAAVAQEKLQPKEQQQLQETHNVAAGLRRLAEHLQEQQQAAAAGTWLSTAAAATQLLEQMPLDAAADACKSSHAEKPKSSTLAMQPMVDCLTKQLQLASQPHLLRPLGLAAVAAAASDTAASSSGSDQGGRKAHHSMVSSSKDQDVTQAAADAAAAVASAAAQRSGVLPLMMLSAAEVGSGAAHMLPSQQQQQQLDAMPTARDAPAHDQRQGLKASAESCNSSSKLLIPARARGATAANCAAAAAVAAPPSAAAARAAAETELVALSCLAVQGVWSAVGQLWGMAAAPPEASSSNRCARASQFYALGY